MIHQDLKEAARLLAEGAFHAVDAETAPLSDRLYLWYLNPTPLPELTGPVLPHELGMPGVLRSAHHDGARFEGGWRAESVSTHGRALAHKGRLSRLLDRSEYTVPARRGLRAQPRDSLLVSRCWDWIDEETGFWHLRRGDWPPEGADRLTRVYWNCPPSGAACVLGAITEALSVDSSAPFMLKTPASPVHHGRADAIVLYLAPDGFSAREAALRDVARVLAHHLRPQTPRMTFRLAPGVAIAEGSLDGDSFGDVRCRLIAAAYERATPDARADEATLMTLIEDAFTDAGLDPARPHLEASRT